MTSCEKVRGRQNCLVYKTRTSGKSRKIDFQCESGNPLAKENCFRRGESRDVSY